MAVPVRRRSFITLDALRGVAALVVLGRHVPDPTLKGWFPGGYLAVDFFFALSGFVLAHAYEGKLRSGYGGVRFVLLRCIRILPQNAIALAIGATMIAFTLWRGTSEVSSLQLTIAVILGVVVLPFPPHMWSGGDALFPINLPTWSLFFELLAGAAYGFGVHRLGAVGSAILLVAAGGSIAAVAVMRGNLDAGGGWLGIEAGFARVTFGFAMGVAVYRFWRSRNRQLRVPAWLPVALLLVLLGLPGNPSNRAVLDLAIVTVFAGVLLLGAQVPPPRRELGLSRLLGLSSYGVYVLQLPIVGAIEIACRKLTDLPLQTFGIWSTLLVLVVVVATAILIELRLDRPLRGKLRRLFSL